MQVDKANAEGAETLSLHERHGLSIGGGHCPAKFVHCIEKGRPPREVAHGDFADHEWMSQNLTVVQESDQVRISSTNVVDPH